jgi:hypothetical protein
MRLRSSEFTMAGSPAYRGTPASALGLVIGRNRKDSWVMANNRPKNHSQVHHSGHSRTLVTGHSCDPASHSHVRHHCRKAGRPCCRCRRRNGSRPAEQFAPVSIGPAAIRYQRISVGTRMRAGAQIRSWGNTLGVNRGAGKGHHHGRSRNQTTLACNPSRADFHLLLTCLYR